MPLELVAIGDSLTQGFQSGAICKTPISYPALIARAMTWGITHPHFPEEQALPLNFEVLARRIGNHFRPWEIWDLATAAALMDEVENYWERGPGSKNDMTTGPLHYNVAVWGFDVVDSITLTEGLCARQVLKTPSKDELFALPDFPMYRTTKRTLNPHFDAQYSELSQVATAKKLAAANGGINHLIFFLGANNALGTVLRLDQPIVWSTEKDLYIPSHERLCNLWTPTNFEQVYEMALKELVSVQAANVYFGTVPHLSIPPVSRGVSFNDPPQDAEGYFEFYIPCWVRDESFKKDPTAFPSFTRDTMRMINNVINQYNATIRTLVAQLQPSGRNWQIVDTCGILDSLAFRRNFGVPTYNFPAGLITAMQNNPATAHRFTAAGLPIIDTRYLCHRPRFSNPEQQYEGGFFSLDGVHPTTIGYGLIAYEFMRVMGLDGQIPQTWWDFVVSSDTLVTNTPLVLQDVMNFLECVGRDGMLKHVLHAIAGFAD